MSSLQPLFAELNRARGSDRHRLRRKLLALQDAERSRRPFDRDLERFRDELMQSQQQRVARLAGLPTPTFDPSLPITAKLDELAAAIQSRQAVIVCGETGSGKSTQLPKLCLKLGRGVDGMIGHTQPRRIAARSIAARVSEELGQQVGQAVGFKVRFTDAVSANSYVKLMTDGVLLAETQSDRFLNAYDTLIVDEAHERSLNIDFLLGFLHGLLRKRRDLKLIVTSATLDAERFAEHFGDAAGPVPIVTVSGRGYPVEIRYRPLVDDEDDEGDDEDPDLQRGVAGAVFEAASMDTGDILVFLPTERDIHETAKTLRGLKLPGDMPGRTTEILPLYARLSPNDQQRIFQPHSYRRIVIATNVAESSLTVPGIRYVIDTGTARFSRYSARTKVQRLPIEPVSQASAQQRAGRCGRVGPGVCFRLYSEADFNARERFTPPEILRTNLASVILQAEALRLGAIEEFPFLDPPKTETIRDGYKTLFELGAVDENRKLTAAGRQLARMPVDPRIARIIAAGNDEGCLNEILIIAAALESQDPRERPLEKQAAADAAHLQFVDPESDFLSYLRIWDFYHDLRDRLGRSAVRRACHASFLSENRLREWVDLHRQLMDVVQETTTWRPQPRRNEYAPIHRALLTGLLSNIAYRDDERGFVGAGNQQASIWPGSGLAARPPRWIVAAEVVETHKRFVRTVARIDPAWIEPLAGHLVTRTYSEPHWTRERASVAAFEKVSLFGCVIVPRRKVSYGRIDPALCREMFIRHALVEGDFETRGPFAAANRELLETVTQELTKLRRLDYLQDEAARFEFFDRLLPADVLDGPRFERWRLEAEKTNPRLLFWDRELLVKPETPVVASGQFPDAVPAGGSRIAIQYRFQPGEADDGASLQVPVPLLNQLDQRRLSWFVPGLIEDKVAALLKSLPRPIRQRLGPATDVARRVIADLKWGEGALQDQVAEAVSRLTSERVTSDMLPEATLPDHLRFNLQVVDVAGKVIAQGRDIVSLQNELGPAATAVFSNQRNSPWHRDGLTNWDFGDLPESVPLRSGELTLPAYPALVDQGATAGLRLLDTPDAARKAHAAGLRRLFSLGVQRKLKSQVEWLPGGDQLFVLAAALPGSPENGRRDFRGEVTDLVARRACLVTGFGPRTKSAFDRWSEECRERVGLAVQDATALLPPLIHAFTAARRAIDSLTDRRWSPAVAEGRSHLKQLVSIGFLCATPWEWLVHFPRYLQGAERRFNKLPRAGLAGDAAAYNQLQPWLEAYADRRADLERRQIADPMLDAFRWLLEEFRVSLFAQELGTAAPVSSKRLQTYWNQVAR
jgi:ATP-dependent helicase HrpA